ncbi:MAG TPA: hypothetical protein VLU95_06510, partial [Candidatus Acidoferrum sp.]|nr:hypothetical protein [Candidatus Acidoferrum sp.]
LLKKTFSLTLMLNSFVTLATITGILYGFYFHAWRSYSPYLIDGNLFLLAAAAALINIFPSASIGRCLHTGRLWFHHYVYGFFVLIIASIFIVAFTSIPLDRLFIVNSSNVAVNAGRFFVLTGLVLFLDDLPDVSKRIESALNKVKSKAYQIRKAIHVTQLISGIVTFYVFLTIALSSFEHHALTVSNFLTMGTLLITSITAIAFVNRKVWLKITIAE